jgi:hypothetical protein
MTAQHYNKVLIVTLLFITVLFISPCFPSTLYSQSNCTPLNQEIPIRSTLASAGFFANFRNADHSINFLMDELLVQAHSEADKRIKLESSCDHSCASPVLATVFDSVPNVTLQDYDEISACQELFEKTKRAPIVYENRSFSSDQEAKDWYHDLTQGDGADGEDLYLRCPGACSPSYSSVAYKQLGRFNVTTSIICGHARDKDDGQYRLSASLRWLCPK